MFFKETPRIHPHLGLFRAQQDPDIFHSWRLKNYSASQSFVQNTWTPESRQAVCTRISDDQKHWHSGTNLSKFSMCGTFWELCEKEKTKESFTEWMKEGWRLLYSYNNWNNIKKIWTIKNVEIHMLLVHYLLFLLFLFFLLLFVLRESVPNNEVKGAGKLCFLLDVPILLSQ